MMQKRTYKVAGHLFSVVMDAGSFIWQKMEECYGPFEVSSDTEGSQVFSLVVTDGIGQENLTPVYSNVGDHEPGFIDLNVFTTDDGGHLFEFIQPMSETVNGRMKIDGRFAEAVLVLDGSRMHRWLTFNVAVDFCFLLSTSSLDTVLTHASAVLYEGRAYLFLGKSGTGKSTHSRMWQESLDGVELMNDDHPVIRVDADGKAYAYGSPWSGKTHCYKNVSAPLGGVIRIVRAPHNKARRLSPVEAYASLMTSCSGMTWDEDQAHGRDRTMQKIISVTPCWAMECLPEPDAASVCMKAVTAPFKEDEA
ncbi:MAG: hypothetical protein II989_01205 [Bacteroidales bacterium]|nr:hypothetical protein [Bacteroidales bacterium]